MSIERLHKMKRGSIVTYRGAKYRIGGINDYFLTLYMGDSESGLILVKDDWGFVSHEQGEFIFT